MSVPRLWNFPLSEMRDNPMVIHLVGETIDAKRAHQPAQSGELIPLVHRLYVDNDRDAEARPSLDTQSASPITAGA